MDIRNTPSKASDDVLDAAAAQFKADAVYAALDKDIAHGFALMKDGKRLTYVRDVDVLGSQARDVATSQPVYRDVLGRLTLAPVGKTAVGILLRGGTHGRHCEVGLFSA